MIDIDSATSPKPIGHGILLDGFNVHMGVEAIGRPRRRPDQSAQPGPGGLPGLEMHTPSVLGKLTDHLKNPLRVFNREKLGGRRINRTVFL